MKEMGWQVHDRHYQTYSSGFCKLRSLIEPVAVQCSKSFRRFQNGVYLAGIVRGADSGVNISSTYLPSHHKPSPCPHLYSCPELPVCDNIKSLLLPTVGSCRRNRTRGPTPELQFIQSIRCDSESYAGLDSNDKSRGDSAFCTLQRRLVPRTSNNHSQRVTCQERSTLKKKKERYQDYVETGCSRFPAQSPYE